MLYQEGDITARKVSQQLGITERSVRRILRDLEREGYIQHRRKGRNNAYSLHLERSLRRSDQFGVSVGELLKLLGSIKETRSSQDVP